MKNILVCVTIASMLFLIAGVSRAENETGAAANKGGQVQKKKQGKAQTKKGSQPPKTKGARAQSMKSGQQPAAKGATNARKKIRPRLAEGVLPKTYVVRNIHSGVRNEQDSPMVRDICSNFRFTDREVHEYFKKAEVISDHVRQYGYQTLPCYVGGEIVLNGETALWEIEASAVGKIQYKNGKIVLFGCRDACQKLFDKK